MTINLCALQLRSGASADENINAIAHALAALPACDDRLVLLPENALCFARKADYLAIAEPLGDGPYQRQLAALAKQHGCYLVCGSFPIQSAQSGKIYTSSLVFSCEGELVCHYHKMHLFDALVADQQGLYKESDTFLTGQSLQIFDWQTTQGCYKVGLAICYDLRFPALFQALRAQGADILLLPAAFTQVTGKAHWQPLLQARAIENQCYLIAANQGGRHPCGRETYGHSMVISPWGEVLEELGNEPGLANASFCKSVIDELRASMPVLSHQRFTSVLK